MPGKVCMCQENLQSVCLEKCVCARKSLKIRPASAWIRNTFNQINVKLAAGHCAAQFKICVLVEIKFNLKHSEVQSIIYVAMRVKKKLLMLVVQNLTSTQMVKHCIS